MILQQFYLKCLAHASYVIGDEACGDAAVIDPQRDVDQYVRFALENGLTIRHVVLTHLHADFIAGHLELNTLTGAAIYLGRAASAEYPFTPLGTGDTIALGPVRLEALETPGHTPESICLLVHDGKTAEPAAVLTGDTLFVGDVGRPDLRAALGWSAADLGSRLYDSLQRLLMLPDASLVYPAHGAGSLCGKALSKETFSTIGEQRRVNYALQPMSKSTFVELVTADQPEAPAYFTYDAVLNSKRRPILYDTLTSELTPLALTDVLTLQREGATLLDTRDAGEFVSAHLAGSLNIGLGGQFATWAGTVLTKDETTVLVANPGAETESALRLGRIGFDNVRGFLAGGLGAADQRPELLASGTRLAPDVAAGRLAGAEPPLALDVRAAGEHAAMWIDGATHIPLTQLSNRLRELPAGRAITVFCAGGYRSSIAASLLRREGRDEVSEIAGGIAAWAAAGLPVSRSASGESG
jgi:glyoxylase-like metal-dependent hydrolase (beta-lactamase superfamily II)/rhodanese-related sulfurtransferase